MHGTQADTVHSASSSPCSPLHVSRNARLPCARPRRWRASGFADGSFYFLAYEALVQSHLRRNGGTRDDISPLYSLSYGALAGYALWGSIYPIDVVKSKLQTDSLDPAKRQFRGMLDCFRQTWRKQGWRGFTGGLEPTLVRSPFANGVTFVAFELAMRVMGGDEKAPSLPESI